MQYSLVRSDVLIVFIIFCLLLISDIVTLLRKKPFTYKNSLSNKKTVNEFILYIGLLVGLGIIGKYFLLNITQLVWLLMMVTVSFLLTVMFNIDAINKKNEFDTLSQFMLRLCIFFRIHKKTIPTLKDSIEGLDERFQNKVNKIIACLESGESIKESFIDFSNHYLMKALLEVFTSSESIGTQYTDYQLQRLEKDIEKWIRQTNAYQQDEQKYQKKMSALILMSLGIAYLAQNMLIQALDVSNVMSYQSLIFVFLSGLMLLIVLMNRRNCNSWFLKEEFL